jgi:hypothetical protein
MTENADGLDKAEQSEEIGALDSFSDGRWEFKNNSSLYKTWNRVGPCEITISLTLTLRSDAKCDAEVQFDAIGRPTRLGRVSPGKSILVTHKIFYTNKQYVEMNFTMVSVDGGGGQYFSYSGISGSLREV